MNELKKKLREIENRTKQYVSERKGRYRGTCLIMAPIFTPENISDGYIQRVKAIDDELLCNTFNIYVDFETKNEEPTITLIDDRHLHITVLSHNKECLNRIIRIQKLCNLQYTHSVMRGMPDMLGKDILKLYDQPGMFYIWDVHGSVPEEFALDDNYYEAQNAGEAEELFIKRADVIITVNNAMKEHLEKKYETELNNVVLLPIFSLSRVDSDELSRAKRNSTYPLTVYAGGVQAWQNIDLMQKVIKETKDKYKYIMCVSRPDIFREVWGEEDYPEDMFVGRKTPRDVFGTYMGCHYGFVLRDDITVNNVACPTKLIEYIQYGIIPVLKTEKIGDFTKLGMKYLTYEEYIKNTPSFSDYLEMANENFEVISRMNDVHSEGIKKLRGIIDEKFNI